MAAAGFGFYDFRRAGRRVLGQLSGVDAMEGAMSRSRMKETEPEQTVQSAAGGATPATVVEANLSAPQRQGGSAGQIAQQATQDHGQEIPHRAQMEAAFGCDFGHVTAHLGADAAACASAVGAEAFAQGDHVVFGTSSPGPELVAHELAHVVQTTGRSRSTGGATTKGDAAEREADSVAQCVSMGRALPSIEQSISPETVAGQWFLEESRGADAQGWELVYDSEEECLRVSPTDADTVDENIAGPGEEDPLADCIAAHFNLPSGTFRMVQHDCENQVRIYRFNHLEAEAHRAVLQELAETAEGNLSLTDGGLSEIIEGGRDELLAQVRGRLDSCLAATQVAVLAEQIEQDRQAAASKAAAVSVITITLGILAPTFAGALAAGIGTATVVHAFVAARASLIVAQAGDVAKRAVGDMAESAFDNDSSQTFLSWVAQAVRVGYQDLQDTLQTMTNEDLLGLRYAYDAEVMTNGHIATQIRQLLARFRAQIQPIGNSQYCQIPPTAGGGSYTEHSRLVWVQRGRSRRLALVQETTTTDVHRPVPPASLVRYIDEDLYDLALNRHAGVSDDEVPVMDASELRRNN